MDLRGFFPVCKALEGGIAVPIPTDGNEAKRAIDRKDSLLIGVGVIKASIEAEYIVFKEKEYGTVGQCLAQM